MKSFKKKYHVERISNKASHPFLLNIHYAHKIPQITYTYGLFEYNDLVGVCCYSQPSSPMIKKGICNGLYMERVLELSRLCLLNNKKYEASFLVSKSLKMLPAPVIVISYADIGQEHIGIVYQACSFIYYGLSVKSKSLVIRGLEDMHPRSLCKRGTVKELKEKYGERAYYKDRTRKHRYVKFIGSKKQKREMLKSLKYKIEEYPKE